MSQFKGSAQGAVDYNSTIIAALELSEKKWVWLFNCLELIGIRGMCWTPAAAGWFPLSSA